MRILAISRGENFSPNLVDNDAKILAAVADGLRAQGHEVIALTEADFIISGTEPAGGAPEVIVHMCRDRRSLSRLSELQNHGVKVINTPRGILNCNREELTRRLLDAGVAHPDSLIVDTADTAAAAQALARGRYDRCWVKRADCQTMRKDDVSFCNCAEDAVKVLESFSRRGISRAVVSKHLPGDLIKFYAVEGTDFFHWFYPLQRGHSKFGYEEINGAARSLPFSLDELRQICSQAARTLRVSVYGGDAIVADDGSIKLIDFNDWPSFSPCRQEAARAIVSII